MVDSPGLNECPIWGGVNAETKSLVRSDGFRSTSERMDGFFDITRAAWLSQRNADEIYKAKLTTWVIEQRRLGIEIPLISSSTIEAVDVQRKLRVSDRLDRFLIFCENKSAGLGDRVNFGLYSGLLGWTESSSDDEVTFLARVAAKKELIQLTRDMGFWVLEISAAGYEYLYELQKVRVSSSQAFIAMWFDTQIIDEVYDDGIQKGVEDAGYHSLLLKRAEYNDKIDDQIIAEIRRSRFMVADFTHGADGVRGSVYFEAGFASGLNIPIIYTCRADRLKEVHFDVRQYNFIDWSNAAELRKRLSVRISATIGDGPNRKL